MKFIRPSNRTLPGNGIPRGPVTRPVHFPYDADSCKIRTECKRIGHCLAKNGCVTPYFYMSCGHITTRQEQESYAVWRPKGKDWWCDRCNKWIKGRVIRRYPPPSEVPLF